MKEETVPPQRGYPKRTVLILVLVIVVLTGIVIFQQLQISYLRPIAYQETVTRNSWVGFITMFYVSQLNGALGITPSFVTVTTNSACASLHKECSGYDYSFSLDNVCQNTTYYGTCNFTDGADIYWYNMFTNVLFLTGYNLNLSQGRTVTVHGDWPQSAMSSLQVGNSMFFQVSTGGGWAASVVSINS